MPEPIFPGFEPDIYVSWLEFCRQRKLEAAKKYANEREKERVEKEARDYEEQRKLIERMFRDALLFQRKITLDEIERNKEARDRERFDKELGKFMQDLSDTEFQILEKIEQSVKEFFIGRESAEFKKFQTDRELQRERDRREPWNRTRDEGRGQNPERSRNW